MIPRDLIFLSVSFSAVRVTTLNVKFPFSGKMKKFFKGKGFLVDKISEDSFYENLLLGLPSLLKACPFVSQVKLKRTPAATLEEVSQWETTNDLRLPEDLRSFFLSTNGFSFTYKFQYSKTDGEEIRHVFAGIEIRPLANLERIDSAESQIVEGDLRILPAYHKVFLLAKLDASSSAVLAQFSPSRPPTIWLHHNGTFYFLCESFSAYFRMALAHVGVPGWQVSANLPEWSTEMLQLLAPGTLNNRQLFENKCERNKIDREIFHAGTDLARPKKTSGRSK